MESKMNLGSIPVVERPNEWSGGIRFTTYRFDVAEVAVDTTKVLAEDLLAEAADQDKIDLAVRTCDFHDIDRAACLYLVGPDVGYPVKIGITDNIKRRMSGIQNGAWQTIKLHALLWTKAGDCWSIEQKVLGDAKRLGMHERGEWLSLTPVSAMDMVIDAARDLRIPIYTSAMAIENQGRALRFLDKIRSITAGSALDW